MRDTTLNSGRRWVAVRNTTEETIPSFAVLAIQDVTDEDGEAVFTVGKADLALIAQVAIGDLSRLLINGPLPIKSLGSGGATDGFPAQVYCHTGALDETYYGPVVGEWGLAPNTWDVDDVVDWTTGFRSFGSEATPAGSSAIWVRPVGLSRVMVAAYGSAANPVSAHECLIFGSFDDNNGYGVIVQDPVTACPQVKVAGAYKLTCHASIGPVDSTEGEMARLIFRKFTGDVLPNVASDLVDEGDYVGARVLSIDADGTDLGYGTDPLYTVENVSMSGIFYLDADDKLTVANWSFADLQVYHCQLWVELIRTTT